MTNLANAVVLFPPLPTITEVAGRMIRQALGQQSVRYPDLTPSVYDCSLVIMTREDGNTETGLAVAIGVAHPVLGKAPIVSTEVYRPLAAMLEQAGIDNAVSRALSRLHPVWEQTKNAADAAGRFTS